MSNHNRRKIIKSNQNNNTEASMKAYLKGKESHNNTEASRRHAYKEKKGFKKLQC